MNSYQFNQCLKMKNPQPESRVQWADSMFELSDALDGDRFEHHRLVRFVLRAAGHL
jgi:hypothetical protein